MKKRIANFIIKLLPKGIIWRIEKPWREKLEKSNTFLNSSYSQNGEDILLQRIFSDKPTGFFVDIGAHHPIRFSNTYWLYLRGWRGINIDATPGCMDAFKRERPEDLNIEVGISDKNQLLKFYVFNEPALNTFNKDEAVKKNGLKSYRIVKTIDVQTRPLSSIFEEYMAGRLTIDYLNIDIEGLDLEALKSNDWNKYRPSVISVESSYSAGPIQQSEVYKFLHAQNYTLISVLYNTLIFVKDGSGANSAVCI